MKHVNPSYYRARLGAIMQIIKEEKGGDRTIKNNHSVLLRNGIVPGELEKRYKKVFDQYQEARLKKGNNEPLTFSEITRFNIWFVMYPEKVVGKEIITTSREFPVSIKGSKEDIINTINKTLKRDLSNRVRVTKVKADAKLKLLQLIKI